MLKSLRSISLAAIIGILSSCFVGCSNNEAITNGPSVVATYTVQGQTGETYPITLYSDGSCQSKNVEETCWEEAGGVITTYNRETNEEFASYTISDRANLKVTFQGVEWGDTLKYNFNIVDKK